jgi:beta-xylosidase
MAFIDNYPGGRTPVLAPITWGSDGFPTITTVNGGWGASYPYPAAKEVLTDFLYTDSFAGDSLSPQWEWNHNPDTEYYSVNDGVVLETATVTSHLYLARNTLTHRIYGPNSRGTIQLTVNNMKTGDRAGLAMLRDSSAYVAIINQGSTFRISQVSGLTMDASWNPLSDGSEEAGVNLPSSTTTIWLRVAANISPGPSDTAQFAYSTDGNTFTSIGSPYQLNNTWEFFMGYRYGIFNYASQSQGGSVVLHSFTMDDQTGVSGAAPNASGSSSTQATTTGASSTGTITSFINTASTSQTSTQSKYGQCGGSGYVGPTLCAAGSTCSVGNPYYSQCL